MMSGPIAFVELKMPLIEQLSTAVFSTLVAMCSRGAMSGAKCGGASNRRPAPYC